VNQRISSANSFDDGCRVNPLLEILVGFLRVKRREALEVGRTSITGAEMGG
jgi:hypothetical protein